MNIDSSGFDERVSRTGSPHPIEAEIQVQTGGTPSSRSSSTRSSAASSGVISASSPIGGSPVQSTASSPVRNSRRRSHTGSRIPTLARSSGIGRRNARQDGARRDARRMSVSAVLGSGQLERSAHGALPPRPASQEGFRPSPLSHNMTTRGIDTGVRTLTRSYSLSHGTPMAPPRPGSAGGPTRASTWDVPTRNVRRGSGTVYPATPAFESGSRVPGPSGFGSFRQPMPNVEADRLDAVLSSFQSSQGEASDEEAESHLRNWWTPSSSRYGLVQDVLSRSGSPFNHQALTNYFSSRRNTPMTFFCDVVRQLSQASNTFPRHTPEATARLSQQEAIERGLEVAVWTVLQHRVPDIQREP